MRSPTETRLRRTFAEVLAGLLATGAAACSGGNGTPFTTDGGTTPTTTVEPGFTSLCSGTTNTARPFLQGLTTSPAIDGAVVRSEVAFTRRGSAEGMHEPAGEDDAWMATNGESNGALCATATDRSACESKVAGYRVLPGTRDACIAQYAIPYDATAECAVSYILYTRGDAVGIARTNEERVALIGTVDTVEEALSLAPPLLTTSCGRSLGTVLPDSGYRRSADGGWDLSLVESQNCEKQSFKVIVHVDYAGKASEVSRQDLSQMPDCFVAGRRPVGLGPEALPSGERGHAVGEHFARMAHLEAASVVAFRRLRRQLARHGAPRELLARVTKAAGDEIRHARAAGALARKYGVRPITPRIAPDEDTTLFAIALENAREGCVRETFGALVAHLQKTRAADPDARACMVAIADEETEHAALSWDIASWIEAQLEPEQRERLAAERRDAVTALARALAEPVDPRVVHLSGVPLPVEALRLLEDLAPTLLAA